MKFQILLYVLGKKIKSKVKKDPEFKKKISDKNCTVQIKTADNSKGRYYTFSNGEVKTASGITEADVSLVWKDAKTAFEVLSSGNQEKSMKALQDGSLKLDGDGAVALWFTDVAKQCR